MRGPHHFGTPFTRIVAPSGAPPKASVGGPVCGDRTISAPPLTRIVAPYGSSTEGPSGSGRMLTLQVLAHPSQVSWPQAITDTSTCDRSRMAYAATIKQRRRHCHLALVSPSTTSSCRRTLARFVAPMRAALGAIPLAARYT